MSDIRLFWGILIALGLIVWWLIPDKRVKKKKSKK